MWDEFLKADHPTPRTYRWFWEFVASKKLPSSLGCLVATGFSPSSPAPNYRGWDCWCLAAQDPSCGIHQVGSSVLRWELLSRCFTSPQTPQSPDARMQCQAALCRMQSRSDVRTIICWLQSDDFQSPTGTCSATNGRPQALASPRDDVSILRVYGAVNRAPPALGRQPHEQVLRQGILITGRFQYVTSIAQNS